MFKKGLAFLLSVALVSSFASTSFAAEPPSDQQETISVQQEAPESMSDEQIAQMEAENEENIISIDEISQMSDSQLESLSLLPLESSAVTRAGAYTSQISMNLYQQINSYYCGPASALQTLAAEGKYSSIAGSTVAAKQNTLASSTNLATTSDNGTWIGCFPRTMNRYSDRQRSWVSDEIRENNKGTLTYYADSNHANGYGVVYLVMTQPLGYYGNVNVGHYISGYGMRFASGSRTDYTRIRAYIMDPHYSSTYAGSHDVSLNQLFNAMNARTAGTDNMVY